MVAHSYSSGKFTGLGPDVYVVRLARRLVIVASLIAANACTVASPTAPVADRSPQSRRTIICVSNGGTQVPQDTLPTLANGSCPIGFDVREWH